MIIAHGIDTRALAKGPGRYCDPLAVYLDHVALNGDQGDEQVTHEVLTEGAYRYGPRVLQWTNEGFIGTARFDSVEEAEAFMAEYQSCLNDDDDVPEEILDDLDFPAGCTIKVDGYGRVAWIVEKVQDDRVYAHMIGDDRTFDTDPDDCTKIDRGSMCGCGELAKAYDEGEG